jgi:hypothetical protein
MRVAHFDKRALKNPPTFKDLDDCIDYLEELLKKYTLIFRATCLTSVLPTWQYEWKDIFLHPWIDNQIFPRYFRGHVPNRSVHVPGIREGRPEDRA